MTIAVISMARNTVITMTSILNFRTFENDGFLLYEDGLTFCNEVSSSWV